MDNNYTNNISSDDEQENINKLNKLKIEIVEFAKTLGFQQLGITHTDLGSHVDRYKEWLDQGLHADLSYMEKHGSKRWTAHELEPGTLRVISVRMNYLSDPNSPLDLLSNGNKAYISRYSLGRDYHKLIRKKLTKLIQFIKEQASENQFRAFVDSAPILERAFAQQSGLGWFGKNTMLINRKAGSWFFLGEIFTDLPLPIDSSYDKNHCGKCTTCMDFCPTNAFVSPYTLDTKRCISYLTIEHKGSIPEELRSLMGNRIFGCDDCQLVCPWNRFAKQSKEEDFSPRNNLESAELIYLFNWSEEEFLKRTEGQAIRRAGYECWQRNIAIALGNAPYNERTIDTLKDKLAKSSPLVKEHIEWAIEKQLSSNISQVVN